MWASGISDERSPRRVDWRHPWVQAAADEGVGHIIVETDAVEVVQAVYSQDFYLSPVAFLVEELRSLLEMNFFILVCPATPSFL